MKKILFVTEEINSPYDEGIKKSVYNIYNYLKENFLVKVICRKGFTDKDIRVVKTNKLFYSSVVKNIIKNYQPDIILYIPFASDTFASYLRLKMLKKFYPKSKTIFVILQPKELKKWQKQLIPYLKPDMGLTSSPQLIEKWNNLSISSKVLPLFTDLNQFKIILKNRKIELRKKYNIPVDKFVISHIGHINWGRNLEALIPLQFADNQIVVVGSSSTPDDAPKEENLKNKLIQKGIIILDGYIKNIEEIYQLSDLYIFPVIFQGGSINMPLSILEARACGIPVLTTDFGSMKHYMEHDNGGIYYSIPDDFLENIEMIKKTHQDINFTSTNIPMINNQFYKTILDSVNEL